MEKHLPEFSSAHEETTATCLTSESSGRSCISSYIGYTCVGITAGVYSKGFESSARLATGGKDGCLKIGSYNRSTGTICILFRGVSGLQISGRVENI